MESILYNVSPKVIDASDTEDDLPEYVIASDFEFMVEKKFNYESADKYIDIDSPTGILGIEIQSSEPINVAEYTSGSLVNEHLGVSNFLLFGNIQNTFKIRNVSGSTAVGLTRIFY